MTITRTDILNAEIKARKTKSYLEIGYGSGENFEAILCDDKECVDPFAPQPVAKGMHRITSDAFFDKYNSHVDMVFVDGSHNYDQAKKDLDNALKHLNPGGVVVMHDTCPKDEEYATEAWCGGVYRVISDVANSRRQLDWKTFMEDHGVTFIWKTKKNNKPTGLQIETWPQWDEHRNDIMRFENFESNDDGSNGNNTDEGI